MVLHPAATAGPAVLPSGCWHNRDGDHKQLSVNLHHINPYISDYIFKYIVTSWAI